MKIKGNVPDGVNLTRDEHGIPHIQAGDLAGAYWGMGYAHARDRAMQMGLMRNLLRTGLYYLNNYHQAMLLTFVLRLLVLR